MTADLSVSGTTLEFREVSIIHVIAGNIASSDFLTNHDGSGSRRQDGLGALEMTLRISSSLTGVNESQEQDPEGVWIVTKGVLEERLFQWRQSLTWKYTENRSANSR